MTIMIDDWPCDVLGRKVTGVDLTPDGVMKVRFALEIARHRLQYRYGHGLYTYDGVTTWRTDGGDPGDENDAH